MPTARKPSQRTEREGAPTEQRVASPVYVEAFTNRTFFWERLARFAPGDAAYAPGDELELCYAAERPDLAGLPPEGLAQMVYGELNPSDFEEPHSLAFPSLSMGDVVSYRGADVEGSLSVELMGFAPVEPSVFASEPEHAAYRRKVGDLRGAGGRDTV